jgi:hypothetical protein
MGRFRTAPAASEWNPITWMPSVQFLDTTIKGMRVVLIRWLESGPRGWISDHVAGDLAT